MRFNFLATARLDEVLSITFYRVRSDTDIMTCCVLKTNIRDKMAPTSNLSDTPVSLAVKHWSCFILNFSKVSSVRTHMSALLSSLNSLNFEFSARWFVDHVVHVRHCIIAYGVNEIRCLPAMLWLSNLFNLTDTFPLFTTAHTPLSPSLSQFRYRPFSARHWWGSHLSEPQWEHRFPDQLFSLFSFSRGLRTQFLSRY